ncbi:HpcH/HpaI aldolase/citrate lyase family protein [Inquilinus sp. CAU 1745]|uniref:HpcH/HpaI aldolase family protein n=1 Tax=Inquilinus sp. CAU 1745 TaxID=3140369 RepID=UPI00325AF48B
MTTHNQFKRRLQQKVPQSGFWLSLSSSSVTEIAAYAGFDWILVDMEHAPNDLSNISDHLRAAKGGTAEVLVRPPFSEPVMVKRLMDIGVRNLMFPMVQSAAEAELAVSWTRYPPHGVRGHSGTTRANGYGRETSYLDSYIDDLCIVVQVETPEAVGRIGEIAAVDGVDAIFIGPGDLAAAMGHVGNVLARDVQEAIAHALGRIHDAGLAGGVLGFGEETARRYFSAGFDFVAAGGDAWLVSRMTTDLAAAVRPTAAAAEPSEC